MKLRRIVSGIMLALLLVGMLTLAINIQLVKVSGTIHIRADGLIDPPTAPILTVDNIAYRFTDNIYDSIVVERDNITVDGAGQTLQGVNATDSIGLDISFRTNVTIANLTITQFSFGIYMNNSRNCTIISNALTQNSFECIRVYESYWNIIAKNEIFRINWDSIVLYGSSNNTIFENRIFTSYDGIRLFQSNNNTITENTLTENTYGIYFVESSSNIIHENSIANNSHGIRLECSSKSSISGNNITNNERGILLSESSNNMVLENNITENKWYNIWLLSSSSNSFFRNNITAGMKYGIHLDYSFNNNISGNNITNNWYAIELWNSCNNNIYENSVTNNGYGLGLYWDSFNNNISGNNITNNLSGVHLYHSSNNNFFGNTLINNTYGLELLNSSNNLLYHNNFICNTKQVNAHDSTNILDNGYPSGGNYWSDYLYGDENGDGIGDIPYFIDMNNQDNYPLMNPWTPPDIAVTDVTPSKTVIGQGFLLHINVTVTNQGNKTEVFNVILYANTTIIALQAVILSGENSTGLSFTWNTTGFAIGNYTISTYATPVEGETDLSDNQFINGIVKVSCIGDVNGDYVTDSQDYQLVKKAIPSLPGESNWLPEADVDGDNVIDGRDYQIVKKHIPSHL